MPNRPLSPEKSGSSSVDLTVSVQKSKGIVTRFSPLYQNKLQVEGCKHVVNINKVKFEPYSDLVD